MKNSLADGFHDDGDVRSTQNGEDDADTNLSTAENRDLNHNDYNAIEESTAHDDGSDDNDEVSYLVIQGSYTESLTRAMEYYGIPKSYSEIQKNTRNSLRCNTIHSGAPTAGKGTPKGH